MALTHITVRGAREHNLKGVDVDIPRDTSTVITGLSGSGLTSNITYAEGSAATWNGSPPGSRGNSGVTG